MLSEIGYCFIILRGKDADSRVYVVTDLMWAG